LGDCNEDLVTTYQAIQKDWKSVVKHLKVYMQAHSKEHYYLRRADNPSSKAKQAARFIYLNCTCWNGLYRVNSQGPFNVPVGTRIY
jgi:DNA adenine methylase